MDWHHHTMITAVANLAGNFPGGTVDLTNRFGLRDDRIATLQMLPFEAES
jgi:hypothetical protein